MNSLLSRLYNRAKTEGKHIPAFVIDNMKKSYDKPTKSMKSSTHKKNKSNKRRKHLKSVDDDG